MKAKKPKAPANPWATLARLITKYGDARATVAWDGGQGEADPAVGRAELKLAKAKLNDHLAYMHRELS